MKYVLLVILMLQILLRFLLNIYSSRNEKEQTIPQQSSESTVNGSSLLLTEPRGFGSSAEESTVV